MEKSFVVIRKVAIILKKCNFCEGIEKVKADFYDYHKNSNMTAFTASMKIADTDYAKNKLAVQINLENAEITPNTHILPWEFIFNINFCPLCGKPLTQR